MYRKIQYLNIRQHTKGENKMSLDSLKSSGSLNKLLDAAKGETKPQEKKSYVDERLWKPELDKSGNGYAVLRFLPAV